MTSRTLSRSARLALAAALILSAASARAAAPLSDYKGNKDPALFTRMPGYFMPFAASIVERDFDGKELSVTEGGKTTKKRIEGRFAQYSYTFDSSRGKQPSAVQILRNLQAAATAVGGKVLFDNGMGTTLLLVKDGRESWVEVTTVNSGAGYYLRIIERQAMQQAVTADAEALKAGLATAGHVEVPGIFFDTGKAEVKAESAPALAEIARLLKESGGLQVWVVGHTDFVGSAEANVTLAGARARAVVQALVKQHGIEAKRLAPFGVGPYAPVAPNATDEGRARNRRVELVVQP